MNIWHLVGGEYPPDCGGVGDYTAQLASALVSSGDAVHVWVPGAHSIEDSGVVVHSLPDTFGAGARAALKHGWTSNPGIVLLQYVPNALGARGANLPFCRWLAAARRDGLDLRVMFHEPYFYFSMHKPWRNALAVIQRRMAAALIRASSRVYVSSEAWRRYLEPYGAAANTLTLPIPSTIPANPPASAIASARQRFGGSKPIVGHFGTFGDHIVHELLPVALKLLQHNPDVRLALIGDRGDGFRQTLASHAPAAAARCVATGRLPPDAVAAALQACDLLIQPYPDGVTTRRTTVMAGLRNGVATMTTDGALTEPLWRETRAAALVPAGDAERMTAAAGDLLSHSGRLSEQGTRGAEVYERRFSIERTIAALRESAAAPVAQ